MISVRHWRMRPAKWVSLIFWLWLTSFVFGFAGGDLFHTAQCPDETALRAARDGGPRLSQSLAHIFSLDADCPTSLLQMGAQGILVLAPTWVAPLFVLLAFAILRSACLSARALSHQSRGPPLSFI